MLYPNRLQTALLFDRSLDELDAIMRDFTRIEQMRSGAQFTLSEDNPGRFYRLFNAESQLMVTFEYLDMPAVAQIFAGALASPYTGILTPDIRERIVRTASHILIEVSHGVLGGVDQDPRVAALMDAVGHHAEGASQPQFEQRLAALALATRIVTDHAMPLAVHWTQSDLLLSGELFDDLAAAAEAPGPLHIHPVLFGPQAAPGEAARIGIRTFGARHWLGREVIVQPSVLPWAANVETIMAFLRVATMPGGYVIPDGDTFGPEDRSLSYRVVHHASGADLGVAAPEAGGLAFYELVPLKHLAHGFVAPEHVPEDNAFDDRAFSPELMPSDAQERMALANEWAEKRRLAEGIGGRFEVRAAGEPGAPTPLSPAPPPTPVIAPSASQPGLPSLTGRGLRSRVFGRKQV